MAVNTRKRSNNASSSKAASSTSASSSSAKKTGRGKSKKGNSNQAFDIASLTNAQKLAVFNSMKKDMSSKKRALDDFEAGEIQAANECLMNEEEDEENSDTDGPSAKHPHQGDPNLTLSTSAPPLTSSTQDDNDDIDNDDEEEQHDRDRDKEDNSVNQTNNDTFGQKQENENENERISGNKLPSPSPWGDHSANGISVNTSQKSTSRPSSSRSFPSSSSASVITQKASKCSTKITEDHFPPDVRVLAIAAKLHLCTVVAFETPFLPCSSNGRLDFIWGVVCDTVEKNKMSQMSLALSRSSNNSDLKQKLITFALYGRTNLMSKIISNARHSVDTSHYGLQEGTVTEVSDRVKWLLDQSHFIFSDLDIENRKYNQHMPFFNPLISKLIGLQWTPSNRSKIDRCQEDILF